MNDVLSESRFLGKSLERSDGRKKVQGEAVYLRDMILPDLLFAAVIRSQLPRARVKEIHKVASLEIPGVIDVITAEEVAEFSPVSIFPNSPKIQRILTDLKRRSI